MTDHPLCTTGSVRLALDPNWCVTTVELLLAVIAVVFGIVVVGAFLIAVAVHHQLVDGDVELQGFKRKERGSN